MSPHSSTRQSTEYGGRDAATLKAIAEIALKDMKDISDVLDKVERQAPLSDEELAFLVQHDLYQNTIQTIDDNSIARELSNASDRGFRRIQAILEQAAQDDKRAAEIMAETGKLPPLSEAQRLLHHPIFQQFVNSCVPSFTPPSLFDQMPQSF